MYLEYEMGARDYKMWIVWIVLSVLTFFIIVETSTSMWLNADTEKVSIKSKWSIQNIQGKILKKNAS